MTCRLKYSDHRQAAALNYLQPCGALNYFGKIKKMRPSILLLFCGLDYYIVRRPYITSDTIAAKI